MGMENGLESMEGLDEKANEKTVVRNPLDYLREWKYRACLGCLMAILIILILSFILYNFVQVAIEESSILVSLIIIIPLFLIWLLVLIIAIYNCGLCNHRKKTKEVSFEEQS